MDKLDIVVVPDHQGRAGAVTWWRLSGVIDYERLTDEWAKRGFAPADLPAPPSDAAALRRALDAYRGPRTLVRALPTGGFAVVDEQFDEDDSATADPEYDVRFKVWLDLTAMSMQFDRELPESEVDRVHEAFERGRRELHHSEVSAWMVKRVRAMQAIGLRDTGGIYFVPEQYVASWSAFADVVAAVSPSRVYEIPALKSDRAVEAIMEAVIDDAASEVEKLTKALDEAGEGSSRGLRSKASRCEALADKLRLYEQLLGRNLDSISERVQAVDARITDLLLLAEA